VRWWERVGAWDETHRFLVDVAAAVVAALFVVPLATNLFYDPDGPALNMISLAMVIPIAWRRTMPVASAATVFTIALGHLLWGLPMVFPADLLVLLALYSVTVHGPPWAYRVAGTGALVGSVLTGVVVSLRDETALEGAVVWSFSLALCALTTFTFGLVRRSRRVAIDALFDRAQRLETERDQQAKIATAAERARIAREMHDIVAHSLSVIIAQADGGRYASAKDPSAAQRSLGTIAETGRAALADMRRLLGVLRPPEPGTGRAGEPGTSTGQTTTVPVTTGQTPAVGALVPQPAVADLAELVAQVREAGVRVSMIRMGTQRNLPPGTGLTVFRICQESLTNILKHAGPDPTATVMLQWAPASLVLEVTDDGRGAAAGSDGAGQGVLGMRERAAMLGGTLTAGPRPGGGFRVRTEIPIPPLPRPESK
jgi:signal transduction histidine kinase